MKTIIAIEAIIKKLHNHRELIRIAPIRYKLDEICKFLTECYINSLIRQILTLIHSKAEPLKLDCNSTKFTEKPSSISNNQIVELPLKLLERDLDELKALNILNNIYATIEFYKEHYASCETRTQLDEILQNDPLLRKIHNVYCAEPANITFTQEEIALLDACVLKIIMFIEEKLRKSMEEIANTAHNWWNDKKLAIFTLLMDVFMHSKILSAVCQITKVISMTIYCNINA